MYKSNIRIIFDLIVNTRWTWWKDSKYPIRNQNQNANLFIIISLHNAYRYALWVGTIKNNYAINLINLK